jgi:hypothetical protein
MRTNICGTSLSSYSGTIIAVIPAALRAVLKSVTKYTDNTANGGGSTASYVTATTDYFFLLSEFEVFGSISYGNTNEKNKQAQYAYYSAGNSKIKYKHNGTSTAALWWLRSPYASYSNSFVCVDTGGTDASPFSDCELLHQFRACGHRRDSQLLHRVLFPRLRARLLRIIRKSRLAPSMGA